MPKTDLVKTKYVGQCKRYCLDSAKNCFSTLKWLAVITEWLAISLAITGWLASCSSSLSKLFRAVEVKNLNLYIWTALKLLIHIGKSFFSKCFVEISLFPCPLSHLLFLREFKSHFSQYKLWHWPWWSQDFNPKASEKETKEVLTS